MSEAETVLQVEGETYQPRLPSPADFIVTPENLALEIEAMREGWSRNVWRRPEGRDHELVLWPRAFHNAPPVTIRAHRDGDTRTLVITTEGAPGRRFDRQSRANLARYRWSFDPARYDQRAEPSRPTTLAARARTLFEAWRPTWTEGPAFRPMVPPYRKWSALDEGGPLDGSDDV